MRNSAVEFFKELQLSIIARLEVLDGKVNFQTDNWQRTEHDGSYGGGGITRVLKNGGVFEQAGVNFSEVEGNLSVEMTEKLTGIKKTERFFATGTSLVIHPFSPMIPTTHANFRYLEVGNLKWFGGGMDLTPYHLFPEDAVHFHTECKKACDQHSTEYYPKFKKWCDEYFYLPHRQETRGIGGLFFDYLGKDDPENLESIFKFVKSAGNAFLNCYAPIVEKHRNEPWGEAEKSFQLLRRGRYVEYNLLYDRGTLFGLKTGGRIESILVSLPPNVRWEYAPETPLDPRQKALLEAVCSTREWV